MLKSDQKLAGYKLYRVTRKLEKPICDSTHKLSEITFLVLRVRCASGVEGEAYILTFQYSAQAIRGAIEDHGQFLDSRYLWETGALLEDYYAMDEYFGIDGVNKWAQSAFNVAMWDAWCRTLGQPVWKVLGTVRNAVMVYGSGGWLSYTEKELLEEVSNYAKRGFKAVKVKVGNNDWKLDLERLTLVRETVGKNIEIMMDANQGMDISSAIQLASAATKLGIVWFEEPILHTDFDGFVKLKQQTGISIAMGEREYSSAALCTLLNRRAIDIWQPDIMRIGGVEQWRDSAAIAASYNIPVLPHYYKEYDVPLLCTIRNGRGAESFDWIDSLIDSPLKIENGIATPKNGPGWGFRFRDDVLEEIK